jgi:hypothetical protein
MQHRKTLSGLIVTPLLAAVLAGPAMAMPIDPSSTSPQREPMTQQDRRGEAAADTSRAPESPAGLPTWPVDPKPVTPISQPTVADSGDGGDVDWPVAALAMAGTLLLGGGMGVVATRRRIGHTQATG